VNPRSIGWIGLPWSQRVSCTWPEVDLENAFSCGNENSIAVCGSDPQRLPRAVLTAKDVLDVHTWRGMDV
jgi:hypothetical protein